MAKDFKPSSESLSASEATLRYLEKAAEVLRAHIRKEGEPPPWVVERIHVAARNLGSAVSYVRHIEDDGRKK